jgi:hypothetical protein
MSGQLPELPRVMTPAQALLDAAEALGEARKAYAEAFLINVSVHNGNTYLARNAAEADHAEALMRAEALYEIAKAELHA